MLRLSPADAIISDIKCPFARIDDLITLDRMRLTAVPKHLPRQFRQFLHVIRAPAGRLTVGGLPDRDSGEPDVARAGRAACAGRVAGRRLIYLLAPLLRDRPLLERRMGLVRSGAQGLAAGESDLRLR